MKKLTFSRGGIHPAEHKITANAPVTPLPAMPKELVLMLGQHIGAPAKALVKKGDHVERGQLLAEAAGVVSAPVHSPVAGTVTKLDTAKTPQGMPVDAIYIKPDDDAQVPSPTGVRECSCPTLNPQPTDIVEAVKAAGIVGLGGATFPTAVKLTPPKGMTPDVVIINAAECEPYLTCDNALMLQRPDAIIRGTKLLMQAAGVDRGVIAIEANKPKAIKLLQSKAGDGVEVVVLKTKYPQGGEKQLIKAVTGKEVPTGALPVATGAIVQNVATAAAVADAVDCGMPLIERIVTVTGPGLSRPGNYLTPLGTPMKDLIEAAGGLPEDTGKIIAGGPMMGRAVQTLDSYTTKGMSGILVLPKAEAARHKTVPCIRCARCVTVCPMGLEPYLISTLSRLGDYEEAEREKVANCIECGSCQWICPSWRPLLDYIRIGKQRALAIQRSRNSK